MGPCVSKCKKQQTTNTAPTLASADVNNQKNKEENVHMHSGSRNGMEIDVGSGGVYNPNELKENKITNDEIILIPPPDEINEQKEDALNMLQALIDMEKQTDQSFEKKLEEAKKQYGKAFSKQQRNPNEVKIFVEGDQAPSEEFY